MRRGDIVLAVAPGDYGKPRPAVVVQSDAFLDSHASIAVCLVTSSLEPAPMFRLLIERSPANGLHARSQIMVDNIVALRRDRLRKKLGSLEPTELRRLNRALMIFLGLP
jgi:mRNA interferase MazF